MKVHVCSILVLLLAAVAVGCSDVGFDSRPKVTCASIARDYVLDCSEDRETMMITQRFGIGEVDILIVNDNSGSMYVEQTKMANAFPNFLNQIANLPFQMAMITTDVTASTTYAAPRPANEFGKLQDGKFIEFTHDDAANTEDGKKTRSGLFYVDSKTPYLDSLFRGTIQRDESFACDKSGYNLYDCPSGDERGIYAANLAINRGGYSGFFRQGAHTAFVFLSDEDERSNGTQGSRPIHGPLEAFDLPTTLVANFKKLYPTKSMSAHAIVTDTPNCKYQQSQGTTAGEIGQQYMALTNPFQIFQSMIDAGATNDDATLWTSNLRTGTVSSICDNTFDTRLGDIAQHIASIAKQGEKPLVCTPISAVRQASTLPAGFEAYATPNVTAQNTVSFPNLPNQVAEVKITYTCSKF